MITAASSAPYKLGVAIARPQYRAGTVTATVLGASTRKVR
jgi:hypothetical protein